MDTAQTTPQTPLFARANKTDYTPEELAAAAGVDGATVRRMIRQGELRGMRLRPRGHWRVPAADAAELLARLGRPLPERS